MIIDFHPHELGFNYDPEYDEYSCPFGTGTLVLWEKGKYDLWELSFVGGDDYQYFIKKGSYGEVLESLKIFIRDKKIEMLLS
jgi:hypothetical protein